MDLGYLFRSMFGLQRGRRHLDTEMDDETDDEKQDDCEFTFIFDHESSSLDDMFQHFHSDIHQQMESLHLQMEDMLKEFGTIASDMIPGIDGRKVFETPQIGPDDKNRMFDFSLPESKQEETRVRDFLLKEDEKPSISSIPSFKDSNKKEGSTFFHKPFQYFHWNQPSVDDRKDKDLDGKVSKADIMDLIKSSDDDTTKQRQPQGFLSGQSVTVTTVRGQDGKLEHKRVVKDSSGREESTISRSIDGQTHTVTTIKGQDGQEERHENFVNLAEDDVNSFEKKWKSPQTKQPPRFPVLVPHGRLDPRDKNILSRFFDDD